MVRLLKKKVNEKKVVGDGAKKVCVQTTELPGAVYRGFTFLVSFRKVLVTVEHKKKGKPVCRFFLAQTDFPFFCLFDYRQQQVKSWLRKRTIDILPQVAWFEHTHCFFAPSPTPFFPFTFFWSKQTKKLWLLFLIIFLSAFLNDTDFFEYFDWSFFYFHFF